MKISELLKVNVPAERKKRGWSQGQLAKLMGVNQSTISRIENKGTISLEDYIKLSDALEQNLYTLIGGENSRTSNLDTQLILQIQLLNQKDKKLLLDFINVLKSQVK